MRVLLLTEPGKVAALNPSHVVCIREISSDVEVLLITGDTIRLPGASYAAVVAAFGSALACDGGDR